MLVLGRYAGEMLYFESASAVFALIVIEVTGDGATFEVRELEGKALERYRAGAGVARSPVRSKRQQAKPANAAVVTYKRKSRLPVAG
ncbi:hypothetical protein EGJ86_19365 [Pseudomonas sp. o96-267]|uniref:hypothetical protein n=1 Tax=Pseudomonas sp. o96-267 TaxID=2479853 RepID=UPI000F76EFDC|nr:MULTISPECIES: hypothetical protein [Pseudomonas]MDH0959072.1 hypothetical protein [Pseudomonas chengduensis]MDV5863620.1 hypothetical protein [Pseudomonas mendocina]RRV31732.1 hypothetical protein EGJ86_19365 [Pseudomonas sp. o96-267]